MGIILDSSILIAAERGGEGVPQILKRVRAAHGETEAGLSAVTIVELTHGIYRARTTRTVSDAGYSPMNSAAT
jgi:predicted nucleic acid-binding protein